MLMIGLFSIIAIQAQTSGTTYPISLSTFSRTAFNYSRSTVYTAAQLKDSISGTASKNWVFYINSPALYYYQVVIAYDTILRKDATHRTQRTVGNHVTIKLEGSVDGVYYTQIDSILYHPTASYISTGAYAIIRNVKMKDVTTGVLWNYLRITGTGGDAVKCAIIPKLMVKIGKRY
jgi:hypothetical protein